MTIPYTVLNSRKACVRALQHADLSSNPGGVMAESASLLFMDGPDHARLRAVVKDVITRLEPLPATVLERIATEVDALADCREIDLVADFGRPVAAIVAAAVLGIDQPLDERILANLSATAANLDVWLDGTAPADTAALRVAMFFLKATPLPGGGLALLRAAEQAGDITEDELMLTPVMLTHAAYENSMNFLAVSGVQLARETQLAERFRTGGESLGSLVRELVNGICPTRFTMRRATAAVDVAGHRIEEGERVAIPLGPEHGLGFGLGRHACPGTRLALAEAEFALRRLAGVLDGAWTVSDLRWKEHPVFHGLERGVITRSGG